MAPTASNVTPLPDPLEQLDTATAADADALLQQLAGDEVDRLLAANPQRPAGGSTDGPRAASATNEPVAAVVLHAPASDNAPVRAIAAATAAPAASIAPPPPIDDLELALEAATEPASAVMTDHSAAVAAELAATLTASDEPATPHDYAPASTRPLPAWAAPLRWLNAPFAGFSDAAREAIGTVAIVTTLNATAVLLYVLIFRRG